MIGTDRLQDLSCPKRELIRHNVYIFHLIDQNNFAIMD